jgi:hypothetical protein
VSILPALLKVLEMIVKEDLEVHLAATSALPNSQHGFCGGRSCTTALATAHAKCMTARQLQLGSRVIGVTAFDLTAAFDTVNAAQLLPKMEALGIRGKAKDWFASYLTGGHQSVDWDGVRSGVVRIQFGVRQGSILGPLLYLIHVADLPDCLGLGRSPTGATQMTPVFGQSATLPMWSGRSCRLLPTGSWHTPRGMAWH